MFWVINLSLDGHRLHLLLWFLCALLEFDLMRVESLCRFPYVIVHFIIFKLSVVHYDWIP